MVHLVWIGGTGLLQSILSSLILKVYHAFAFKPITIKFGEFTNFWMLFQMTCPIFNSIDIEYSYQEKICSYPVPCSFRTWPIVADPDLQLRRGPVFESLNMNVKFCEDNSGTSKKMRHFRKNKVGAVPGPLPWICHWGC